MTGVNRLLWLQIQIEWGGWGSRENREDAAAIAQVGEDNG